MTAPVIIDIIAAALLIGFALYGAKRGLFRALAGLLIVVLALVGARFAAEALTPPAARLAAPVIQRHIEKKLDAALEDAELSGEILPEELLGFLGIAGDRLESLAEQARQGARDTGASILSAVARSVAESFLYGLFYCLVFLLLVVLLNLAARVVDLALKLPGFQGANALGGAVVGLIEGVLAVFLLAWILKKLDISPEGSYILKFLLQFAARR